MATKGEQFAGLTVALVTPFKDGGVDYDALLRLVDWHIEQGTDCLAPTGTTGESPTLDHEEHERVIATVVERSHGRMLVMPGTGSNSTREALRLTKFAKRAGADGALMVGPYYNKPTQEGYYRHFATVAEAVDLPIVLYNIPGRTGSNMLPETIARLAKLPAIVGIKEATGSLGPGLRDRRLVRSDDPVRRRQPHVAAVEHRRPRRGFRGGKHRAARHEGPAQCVPGRQDSRSPKLAPKTIPAVPRHARRRHQPHSHQNRDEAHGSRFGRVAPADVFDGCRGGRQIEGNAGKIWTHEGMMLITTVSTNSDFAKRMMLLAKPAEQFRPTATYDLDGDCIEFLAKPDPFYAERVDNLVTVYCSQETGEVIGSLIKGVTVFYRDFISKNPGFRIVIDDGPVRLEHFFLALVVFAAQIRGRSRR